MSTLAGKKAVVFGGTSGIGLAACHQLVAAGVEVVAASRDPDKSGRGEMPAGVRLVRCDVRDGEALAAALAREAPYDILISSATGGERAIGPFMTMDMAGFQASFDKLCAYHAFRYVQMYLSPYRPTRSAGLRKSHEEPAVHAL